ncbi:MAG: glutamine amidotransferase [Elusimicrobiota bacterium]
MHDIETSVPAIILTVVFALAAGAVTYLFYRKHALRQKVAVWIRLCVYILALMLILQPVYVNYDAPVRKNVVPVFIDNSRSMAYGGPRSRWDEAKVWLNNDALKSLGHRFSLKYYTFSSSTAVPYNLSAGPTGEYTDLSAVFKQVSTEYNNAVPGIIIVTDGIHNNSQINIMAQVKDVAYPVNCVATSAQVEHDIALENLSYSSIAFKNVDTKIGVDITGTGYENTEVVVTLNEAGAVLQKKVVKLDSNGKGRAGFDFLSDYVGERKLSVQAPVIAGELVKNNNVKDFTLSIIREKIRVLYICGQANYEYSYLRNVLKGDPSIELVSFIILRNPENIAFVSDDQLSLIPFPHQEIFMNYLPQFDLLIFENFAYQRFAITPAMLEKLAWFVKEKGGGFLMIGGDNAFGRGGYKETAVERILPVEIGGYEEQVDTQKFNLKLAVPQHPVVALSTDFDENKRLWGLMPELEGCNITGDAKPGATVVGVHPKITTARGSLPVLTLWDYGNGRVMSLASNTTWRWAMGLAKIGKGKELYDRFWSQSVRWLTRGEQLSAVRVVAEKSEVSLNEKVLIKITVLDDQYRLDNSARVKVVVQLPQKDVRTDISDTAMLVKPGEYWVEYLPSTAGKYYFKITAYGRRGLAGDTGITVNAKSFGEDDELRPNMELLNAIAGVTQGGVSSIKEFNPGQLNFLSAKSSAAVKFRYRVWTEWYFYLLLTIILCIEWFLRRMRGLP